MYKDKEKQKQANKEYQRRRRGVTEGVTSDQGVTEPPLVGGVTGYDKGVTKPRGVTRVKVPGVTSGYDIANKLVDPVWRDRLTRICSQFHKSPLAHHVQLGVYGPDLSVVEEMLEITA